MSRSDNDGQPSWDQLLNCMRLGGREPKQELGRSPFNSDHDKVVFSGAFRRLARKTQVHPLATNDHVHNRLTHSLEVACIGRSLGINVGYSLRDKGSLPEGMAPTDIGDIVQAACLAHDIGNPPFGHTGEEAIRHWFNKDGSEYLSGLTGAQQQDFKQYEGNAQGLRILTTSEYYPNDGGMRLTYATLASFIKYPWTSVCPDSKERPKQGKYGVFQSELKLFTEIAEAVGLKKIGADWYNRHPLVYLMEAADDFCYGLLDLEDGLEMGIVSWDQVYSIIEPLIDRKEKNSVRAYLSGVRDGRKPPIVRGKIISRCVGSAVTAFRQHEEEIIRGLHPDLISLCDSEVGAYVAEAKSIANKEIFSHRRKVELEIGAYSAIATILEVMCDAVTEIIKEPRGGKLPFKASRVCNLLGEDTFSSKELLGVKGDAADVKYHALMRVLDFVSGMTDNYAVYLTRQFRGTGN